MKEASLYRCIKVSLEFVNNGNRYYHENARNIIRMCISLCSIMIALNFHCNISGLFGAAQQSRAQ